MSGRPPASGGGGSGGPRSSGALFSKFFYVPDPDQPPPIPMPGINEAPEGSSSVAAGDHKQPNAFVTPPPSHPVSAANRAPASVHTPSGFELVFTPKRASHLAPTPEHNITPLRSEPALVPLPFPLPALPTPSPLVAAGSNTTSGGVGATIAAVPPVLPSASSSGSTPPSATVMRQKRYKREWLYCVQMPSFVKGSDSEEEKRFKRLVSLIVETFGTIRNDIRDPNTFKLPCYSARSRGQLDKRFSYIKVACSVPKLHEFAEADMIRRRIKRSCGGGFGVFERSQQYKYVHPGCTHRDAQDDLHVDPTKYPPNDCDCCQVLTHDGKCACCMLKPSNKSDIMRRRMDQCFNQLMGVTENGLALAMKEKVVIDAFPLHTLEKDSRGYISRRHAVSHFFGWRSMCQSAMDFTSTGSRWASYIRDYLGEKVGMYFAFLQSYTTALMVLSIPGTLIGISEYFGPETDNPAIMIYSIFVSLWAVGFVQYWIRRQSVLAHKWDMQEYEEKEAELPEFRVSAHGAKPGFYEIHGEWVDLQSYSEKAIAKHGEAVKEWIPKSRLYENNSMLPTGCFTDDAEGEAANTMWWRSIQKLISINVMLLLVFGVVVASVSLLILKVVFTQSLKLYGGIIAGVLSGIAIELMDTVYQFVALRLNDWENYRTQSQYEEALVYKMVLFQVINNYFILFYIAFLKGHYAVFGLLNEQCVDSTGAVASDCMTELSTQVTSVMLTRLAIGNVLEVGVPWLKTRFTICFKTCRTDATAIDPDAAVVDVQIEGGPAGSALNSPLLTNGKANNSSSAGMAAFAGINLAARIAKPKAFEKKKPHQAEVESLKTKYGEGAVGGTFWDYNELLIQFGYVVLFAPAFPMASTVSFLSNITENSGDGAKLLLETQRPQYAGAENIGTWLSMFRLFAFFGVITNSLIIGFTSHELRDLTGNEMSGLQRLIIVVILEHAILTVQFVMSVMVPEVPGWLRQIQVRTAAIRKIEDEYEEFKATQAAAGIDPNDLETDKAEAGDESFQVTFEDMNSCDEKDENIREVVHLPAPKAKAPPLLKQWSIVTAPAADGKSAVQVGSHTLTEPAAPQFRSSVGIGGTGGAPYARLSHAGSSLHHHAGSRSFHSKEFKQGSFHDLKR